MRSLVALALMVLGACVDTRPLPTGVEGAPPVRSAALATGAESTWNAISFETTSWRESDDSAPSANTPARSARTRIKRWLLADGWHTKVTLLPSPSERQEAGNMTTMEFDAHGQLSGAWDADGRSVAIPVAAQAPPNASAKFAKALEAHNVRSPRRQPLALASRATRPPASGTGTAQERRPGAFDYWIVTLQSHDRAAARLAREYGAPVESSGSRQVFRSIRGSIARERTLDRTTGAVVDETTTDAHGRSTRVTRQFTPLGGGRFALLRVETEVTTPGVATRRFIQEYAAVRVEGDAR